jgi:hypothetical protein
LDGLNEQEIARIEHQYQVCFPPDYRLFLHLLHSVDRPRVGSDWDDDGKTMISSAEPSFYNWLPSSVSRFLGERTFASRGREETTTGQRADAEVPFFPLETQPCHGLLGRMWYAQESKRRDGIRETVRLHETCLMGRNAGTVASYACRPPKEIEKAAEKRTRASVSARGEKIHAGIASLFWAV